MPTETLEETRQIILSLLVARPSFTPLTVLDRDYYEAEGIRIPWRKFGFGNLLEFLKSMPRYFQLAHINGVNCIRGISEKSKHVSSLVARQKKPPRTSRPYRSMYQLSTSRPRPKISAEHLNNLVQYVKQYPNGININFILKIMQNELRNVPLTIQDIQNQVREVGHQLYLKGDKVCPVMRNDSIPQAIISERCQSPLVASEAPVSMPASMPGPSSSNVVYTVPEECSSDILLDEDKDGFVRSLKQKTDERLISSLTEYPNYKETTNYHNHHDNQKEKDGNFFTDQNLSMTENKSHDLLSLISQRMQLRLQKLTQKYPDGILSSKLSDLYMKEYNVPLNYTELGFNSVCTFASYLPNIFYLTRQSMNDDFTLYSADKRLKEQNEKWTGNDHQETFKNSAQETMSKTKPINKSDLQFKLPDTDDDSTPFPGDFCHEELDKFAPDNATFENVSYISVTDLQQDKKHFLEVYIVEVFTPSFFWIHLRKNLKNLDKLMISLHDFYEKSCNMYSIPKLALRRGLNCACKYKNDWHRAIIKTVKPDYKVTVMFYDYGTQKTVTAEEVFYLAKQFIKLPAQAVPCGLYNVKPYVEDRWKKSITDRFIDRISNTLLAATVVSIDPPNNSMLIVLTDTSEDEDVNINDWLVEQKLARHGKMGDSVDMASLIQFVENIEGRMPSYCYAEEYPVSITDNCTKSTAMKDCSESFKISPGPNFACSDNQRSPSVPPGFAALPNDHADQFSAQTDRHYVHPTLSDTRTPFSDLTEDAANGSPYPDGSSKLSASNIPPSDIDKKIFMKFVQENSDLQVQLTQIFCYLLQNPPSTADVCFDYTKLVFHFNNTLRVLLGELNRLSSVTPKPSQNHENENTDLSSEKSHHNPNFSGEYYKRISQYAYNPYRLQARGHNFRQATNPTVVGSHQADANRSSTVQQSSSSSSFDSLMLNNRHENVAKSTSNMPNTKTPLSSYSDLRNGMTNDANSKTCATDANFFPSDSEKQTFAQLYVEHMLHNTTSSTTTASHANNTSNVHSSNYGTSKFANVCLQHENTYRNEEPTRRKETNPFLFYQNDEQRSSAEQNTHNSYDMSNLRSYLPDAKAQHNYTPTANENVNAADCNSHESYRNITPMSELDVDFASRDYSRMSYEDTKVNSNSNYAPRIIYESGPVMYNLQKKPEEEQQLPPQSQSNIVSNGADHVVPSSTTIDMSALNDEGYNTSSQTHSSPPMTVAADPYQLDVNRNVSPQPVSLNDWTSSVINDSSQVYSKNSASNTIFPPTNFLHKEWNCETNRESISGDSYETAGPNYVSLNDGSERTSIVTNFWNSFVSKDYEETTSSSYNSILNTSFLFQKIDSVEGITLLFHIDEYGWILLSEFVETFTKFSKPYCLPLESTSLPNSLKKLHRSQYPVQFLQLDSYPLNVVRDSKDRIMSLNLISLQAALGILNRAKLISLEEIESACKGIKTFVNNPVMLNMWELITTYKKFRHYIEQCSIDYEV